jgi:medium-chain acyl-[acyl-carrier-protein] hydrolase
MELRAVSLPGRESRLREPPFTRVRSLVDALVPDVAPLLDAPCAIFGHSLGAIVGFELARALRDRTGVEPVHLFVSACRAPDDGDPRKPLHRLTRPELVRELRRLDGFDPEVLGNDELLDLVLPALRADLAMLDTYRYDAGAPLECPITTFAGMDDTHAPPERVLAWRRHTTTSFTLRAYPGGHFFLREGASPVLAGIADDLSASLGAPPRHAAGGRL